MAALLLARPAADRVASHLVNSLRPLEPTYKRNAQGGDGVRCGDCINACVVGAKRREGMTGNHSGPRTYDRVRVAPGRTT